MLESDCYLVLGLSREANLSQIRRAYRELCRRFDPDRTDAPAGPSTASGMFDRVHHAYAALSNPAARADHDRELMAREQDLPDEPSPDSLPPLSPPRHLFDDYEHHHPSADELRRVLLENYTERLPKAHPMRAVDVEVVLDRDQAARGGVVPFRVPAAQPCGVCAGTGRTGFFHCDACDGNGVTWSLAAVDVVIPRDVRTGTSFPVSLAPVGVRTLFLNVTVRTVDAA